MKEFGTRLRLKSWADGTPLVTERVRALRKRARLSMQNLAVAVGYRGASSWQRYEDPSAYRKKHLPLDIALRLEPVLVGQGHPPIASEEVYALAGVKPPNRSG